MNKYKIVSASSEPSVIGVRSGVCQVELKDNGSFVSKEEKKYYENYFNGNFNAFILENFKNVDLSLLTELTYFPLKSAKETDFVRFSPNEMGLNFLVSQKVIDVIEKFPIDNYIKIPSKINGFTNKYYTVGFPIITEDKINYNQSIFYHLIQQKELSNLSKDDYKKISGALVKTKSIELLGCEAKSDIINLEGQGIFFSTSLITQLQEKKIIGLEIGQTTLNLAEGNAGNAPNRELSK